MNEQKKDYKYLVYNFIDITYHTPHLLILYSMERFKNLEFSYQLRAL